MSTSIHELDGSHIGSNVTITDTYSKLTATGTLFSVSHEASMVSMGTMGTGPAFAIGVRTIRVNLAGKLDLRLSETATFETSAQ